MHVNQNVSFRNVAKKLGIKSKTQVLNWVKAYKEKGEAAFDVKTRGKSKGPRKGSTKTKFASQDEEIRYQRMENEFLKKLKALLEIKEVDLYAIIKSMSERYSITSLCTLVGLSRSGYYKWLKKPNMLTDREQENVLIKSYIKELHEDYTITSDKQIRIYLNKVLIRTFL